MFKRRDPYREDSFVLVLWHSTKLQTTSKRLFASRRDARIRQDAEQCKDPLGDIWQARPLSLLMTSERHPRQRRRKPHRAQPRTREIHVPQPEHGCSNAPRWHEQQHRYAHGYAPLSRESLVLANRRL